MLDEARNLERHGARPAPAESNRAHWQNRNVGPRSQHTNIRPPIVWAHGRMCMGEDELGGVAAQHMPARRKPELPEAGVVCQEAIILSFTTEQLRCAFKDKDT